MTWILIWVLSGSFGGTSGSQEFNTKQACEAAKKLILNYSVPAANQWAKCIEKGEAK